MQGGQRSGFFACVVGTLATLAVLVGPSPVLAQAGMAQPDPAAAAVQQPAEPGGMVAPPQVGGQPNQQGDQGQAVPGLAEPGQLVTPPGPGQPPAPTAPPVAPPTGPAVLPGPSQESTVQYVELRPPEGKTDRYYTQLRSREILGILSSGTVPPDKEAVFREYYQEFALARWTWPENFGRLPELRRELRNDLFTARGKPVHAQLRQLAFEILGRFARDEGGPYHPATRVSAILAIADLNATESVNPREQPVVPLPEAAALLVELLKRDDLPDPLVAAVLVGLRRHAILGIEDQQLVDNELVPRLLTIAGNRVPPAGRSLEGHQWIRARAIEVLGLLGLPGQNGAVPQLLVTVLGASDESPMVRRAAARALGVIDFTGVNKPTPAEILYALGRYISDVCEAEVKQLDQQIQMGDLPAGGPLAMGSMGGYGYPGGYVSEYGPEAYMPDLAPPGMMGSPGAYPGRPRQQTTTEDRTLPNRRRLKAQLNAAFYAITGVDEPMWVPANRPMDGVAAVVPESGPAREGLQQLFERLQALLAICDTKDLERQTLRDRIRAELDQVQELILKLESLPQTTAGVPAASPQT